MSEKTWSMSLRIQRFSPFGYIRLGGGKSPAATCRCNVRGEILNISHTSLVEKSLSIYTSVMRGGDCRKVARVGVPPIHTLRKMTSARLYSSGFNIHLKADASLRKTIFLSETSKLRLRSAACSGNPSFSRSLFNALSFRWRTRLVNASKISPL